MQKEQRGDLCSFYVGFALGVEINSKKFLCQAPFLKQNITLLLSVLLWCIELYAFCLLYSILVFFIPLFC